MAFKKLIEVLEEFQGLYLKALGRQIKQKDIVASGALGDSLNPAITAQPKVSVFGGLYEMKVEMLDYGDEVDQGTQPKGKLPNTFTVAKNQKDILLWLTYPNVKDKLQIEGLSQEEREGLAATISMNIEKGGVAPRNFLEPAINPIHSKIKPRFADAVADSVVFSIEEMNRIVEENTK